MQNGSVTWPKRAKAQAKREKRLDKSEFEEDLDTEDETARDGPTLSNTDVMDRIEDLHRRYDDGQMDLDTFDEQKALLMAQISID